MKRNITKLTRRRFIKTMTAAGSSLAIGVSLPARSRATSGGTIPGRENTEGFGPNAWIEISTDDTITVNVNHSELGQGITTALSMIVAEELDADWSRVRAQIAPVAAVYKNPKFKTQMTAASTSVSTSWKILRNAGAAARAMLVSAAANTWNVPVTDCRTENGKVIHKASGRSLCYGQLVKAAQSLSIPKTVELKKPSEFRLIGRRMHRLDTTDKTNGTAVFGVDVKLPGLLTATVIHPPVFGSKVRSFNDDKALRLPGVKHVLAIDQGIAIVADTFWQALKGAESLKIEWQNPDTRIINSAELWRRWAEMAKKSGKSIYESGEVNRGFEEGTRRIQAVYQVPYQAHATPEPMNCTAHVRTDGCDVWAPTQHQDAAQETAAVITGLNYSAVNIQTPYVGGGFGRRVTVDYVSEAVEISKKIHAPVKVIWTREEDMQNDVYRPATVNLLRAALNDRGMPIAWLHRIVGTDHMAQRLPKLIPSILPYWVPRMVRNDIVLLAENLLPRIVPGKKGVEGAAPLPYGIDHVKVEFTQDDPGVPVGFWRSVAFSGNVFAVECFIDEIAAASGKDPYRLRWELLISNPFLRNVLDMAAQKAGWDQNPPAGIYRSIVVHEFHHTAISYVIEVSVNPNGMISVHRFVCAVDCGIVINPKIVQAQIAGGTAFGLTAALKSEVTIKEGRVQQRNFDDFPLLSMDEMPKVEVHMVKSTRPPTGIGEAGVPLVAPAIANAVFAATGRRIRKLPIRPEDVNAG